MSHTQLVVETIEKVHTTRINCVAVSPDGKFVATGSKNKLMLWDRTRSPAEGGTIIHPYDDEGVEYLSVLFNADGSEFVSSDSDYHICVWDTKTLKCVRDAELDIAELCYHLAFATAPDGGIDLLVPASTKLRVFDYRLLGTRNYMDLHPAVFANVALALPCADEHESYLIGGINDIVVCRAPRVGTDDKAVITKTFGGHTQSVTALSLAVDGTHFFSASGDGSIRMWNLGTCACVWTINCCVGTIWGMTNIPYFKDRDGDHYQILCATSTGGVICVCVNDKGEIIPRPGTFINNLSVSATAIARSSPTLPTDTAVLVCGWENGDVSIRAPRTIEAKAARKRVGMAVAPTEN